MDRIKVQLPTCTTTVLFHGFDHDCIPYTKSFAISSTYSI